MCLFTMIVGITYEMVNNASYNCYIVAIILARNSSDIYLFLIYP